MTHELQLSKVNRKQTWFGKPADFKVINNGYTIYVGKDMKVHNSFVLGSLVFKCMPERLDPNVPIG